ncbi:MAG: ATP-binding protein, partial [Actinomycetota bacterium]|nr:ATP-binding protein [Actinomycetota bacterium]
IARRNLEEKAEQLALSSRYKSEFLANMSHELRTPLNSLLILSKLLADNEDRSLSDKQVEYAGTIHSAGSDLLSLINDILDLSKVEAGKMEVRPAPVVLEDVRDYVERAFRPVAEEKGLAFEVELGPELPRTVTTDEQRLQQVLKNLLSNAFKFTGEGVVTLRLEPAPDGRIAFSVADTGVGIPDDKLRLIFEAFQQGEGGMSRKYGGTGLGLSISREIARLLGGELGVRSAPGEGSEFTLLLPAEYVPVDTEPVTLTEPAPELVAPTVPHSQANGRPLTEAMVEHPSLTPADRALLEGRKVLLVDDDVRNVFALASLLETQGMEVLFAENGRDAIETLRESPDVDLVLMDIMMPEMDGHEAVRRIREMADFKDLPIVALTAKAMQGDREKSLLAGASDYVAKPVDSDRLLSLMRGWLQG